MSRGVVITGTDTGIGKTVFSAGLTNVLCGYYWKPVQSGLDDETDSEAVARLGVPRTRTLPESYRLKAPLSPHVSARLDDVSIDTTSLSPPHVDGPLVVEGAGGVLVPLSNQVLFADLFARWRFPVILCARTTLGTINHTLLSIEALRHRGIDILGVAFIGEENAETQRSVVQFGCVRSLGRLPWLSALTSRTLREAFAESIDTSHIRDLLK